MADKHDRSTPKIIGEEPADSPAEWPPKLEAPDLGDTAGRGRGTLMQALAFVGGFVTSFLFCAPVCLTIPGSLYNSLLPIPLFLVVSWRFGIKNRALGWGLAIGSVLGSVSATLIARAVAPFSDLD
jgi:hypothetical protein